MRKRTIQKKDIEDVNDLTFSPDSITIANDMYDEDKSNRSAIRNKFKNVPLKIIAIVMTVLFVGASASAVYAYTMYQNSQKQINSLKNTKDTSRLETQKTIDAVAKHIVLPQDENPTIATVTDSKKLSSQAFFSKASNGDKVLIYTKSRKAILFNPKQNKVVEVAPINIGENKASDVAGITAAPTRRVLPTVQTQ